MTKYETGTLILVRKINDLGGLMNLGTNPTDSTFHSKECRFVKSLYEAGEIFWVGHTDRLGSGWILKGRNPLNPVENITSRA
jgi:hypothetical protein